MPTTFLQKKNGAKSTITNNPLSAGGLSITLTTGQGSRFPTSGQWIATLYNSTLYPDPNDDPSLEHVLIDSRSSDTLTVNASGRGYAGTTGVAHASGTAIRLLVMKEHVDEWELAIHNLEALTYPSATFTAGDMVYASSTTVLGKLAIGANNTILVSNGSAPTWSNAITSPRVVTSILDSSGNELIKLTATGSAVNEITLANAATGANPALTASGDDTNIGFNIVPKGTGAFVIRRNDGTNGVSISDDATSVIINKLAAGNNIDLQVDGATGLKVVGGGVITPIIYDTSSNELIKFTATGSAVNELTVTNAATGGNPEIQATGGDTNIGINIRPKGTGGLVVRRNDGTNGVSITDDGTDAVINKASALNNIRFKINSVSLYAMDASALYPATDNTYSCGANGLRWTAVWAANGTIQTSFLSEKNVSKWVEDEECLRQLPRVIEYQWKEAKDKKTHLGIVGDDLPKVATMGDEKNIESMAVTAIAIGASRALLKRVEALESIVKNNVRG